MLYGVHGHSSLGEIGPGSGGSRASTGLTQAEITALPSIMGQVAASDRDTTARVDRAGYVYLWEPGEVTGFWVQAGYLRNGRARFGTVIDPNDIQWFNLAIFRKKILQAKKSLNAVRLPGKDDIWDVANESENRKSYEAKITDRIGTTSLTLEDPDVDLI